MFFLIRLVSMIKAKTKELAQQITIGKRKTTIITETKQNVLHNSTTIQTTENIKNQDLVSYIVTIYYSEKYLAHCIENLLAHT